MSEDLIKYLLSNLRDHVDQLMELAQATEPNMDFVDYHHVRATDIITKLEGVKANEQRGHSERPNGGHLSPRYEAANS